jgi:MFS family permease
MADIIPADRRGRFYGTRNTATNAITILSGIAIGKYLDLHNSFNGFAVVFAVAVVFGVADLIIHAFVPEPKPHAASSAVPFKTRLMEPLKDPYYSGFVYFTLAWNFAMWVMLPFLAVYQIETLKMSYLSITNQNNLYMASMMVSSFFVGKTIDRFGGKVVFVWSTLGITTMPLFWLFMNRGNYIPLLTALNIISGILNSGNLVAINKLLLENSPRTKRSVYISIYSALGGLAGVMGPVLGGRIGDIFTGRSLSLGLWTFSGLQIVFLISMVLRIFCWPLLFKVTEGRDEEAEEDLEEVLG